MTRYILFAYPDSAALTDLPQLRSPTSGLTVETQNITGLNIPIQHFRQFGPFQTIPDAEATRVLSRRTLTFKLVRDNGADGRSLVRIDTDGTSGNVTAIRFPQIWGADDGTPAALKIKINVALSDGIWTDTNGFDISDWDVSQVTDMNNLFYASTTFNQNISRWDVSQVTNMESMFYSASAFQGDLADWNVSQVTNMKAMFRGSSFQGDLADWNVSAVQNMQQMFYGASSFTGDDLSGWDVSAVTNMSNMFYNAVLFNSDLSDWEDKVSQVTNMTAMFEGATAFIDTVPNLSSWVVTISQPSYWGGITNQPIWA